MKNIADFIKTTLKGGIWFLIPFVVLWIIVGKAHDVSSRIAAPLAERIPVETVLGVGLVRVLTAGIVVLACFGAGLFSKTKMARTFVNWLESKLLNKFPGYEFLKTVGDQLLHLEKGEKHDVVLAKIEDAWQIGYITENLDNGLFAVFIPEAPTPFSGGLYFMTEDRFKRLSISIPQAQQCLRRLGHGSKAILAELKPR